MVNEYNNLLLRDKKKPVARIPATNNINIKTSESEDTAIGLPSILNLSIETRVMLRMNLWVNGGLVNGTMGTVKDIVYKSGEKPPSVPAYILIEFDDYKGPYITSNCFPIVPLVRSWSRTGIQLQRTQFPITPAHAITIHKAQGLTLSRIAVDIGPHERSLGLTYVALSRVRSLNNLLMLKVYPKNRFDSIKNSKEFLPKLEFIKRLRDKKSLEGGLILFVHL